MGFTEAKKENLKAKVLLTGPAGVGKSFTGLQLLTALGCKNIGVIDFERGRINMYADRFKFGVSMPVDGDPRAFLKELQESKKAGLDGLFVDGFSAVWNGKNGTLEKVDQLGGNKFSNGWKTYNPLMSEIVDTILTYPTHLVATMRSKTGYVVDTVDGKSIPRKIGLQPIGRDGIEFEFDLWIELKDKTELSIGKQRNMDSLEQFNGTRKDLPMIYSELKKELGIV